MKVSWTSLARAWRARPRACGRTLLFVSLVAALGSQPRGLLAQDQATAPIQVQFGSIADADGNAVTELDTLLFHKGSDPLTAIVAPDGHQLTVAEWHPVGGEVYIERQADGTAVSIDATGLVPNGLYTAWGFYFNDPVFNADPAMPNFLQAAGAGSLGFNDGSQSVFQAGADGTASFLVTHPGGPLSIVGEAPPYALDGVENFVVSGFYHYGGQTFGTVPGPGSVGHFMAAFNPIPEPSGLALAACAAIGLVGSAVVRRKR